MEMFFFREWMDRGCRRAPAMLTQLGDAATICKGHLYRQNEIKYPHMRCYARTCALQPTRAQQEPLIRTLMRATGSGFVLHSTHYIYFPLRTPCPFPFALYRGVPRRFARSCFITSSRLGKSLTSLSSFFSCVFPGSSTGCRGRNDRERKNNDVLFS